VALAAETRFNDIRLFDVTDSTNRVCMAAAEEGAPEGMVVVADLQTAGRGRLDRTWEARPGEALLVSVLLRPDLPPGRWHLLTAAAALSARRACRTVASVAPSIKWPNDLMLREGKLAGILAEAGRSAVVVGMGLNVKGGPPGSADLETAAGVPVDRSSLLLAWLTELEQLLGDWESVSSRYRDECATVGRVVDVVTPRQTYEGVLAQAIDDDGCLVIRTPTGTQRISAGDVTHLRPASGSW